MTLFQREYVQKFIISAYWWYKDYNLMNTVVEMFICMSSSHSCRRWDYCRSNFPRHSCGDADVRSRRGNIAGSRRASDRICTRRSRGPPPSGPLGTWIPSSWRRHSRALRRASRSGRFRSWTPSLPGIRRDIHDRQHSSRTDCTRSACFPSWSIRTDVGNLPMDLLAVKVTSRSKLKIVYWLISREFTWSCERPAQLTSIGYWQG